MPNAAALAASSIAPTRRRVYGGQAHAERQAGRRQRLIEAGIRRFGTEGYAGTTVRALCAEAGLNARYFYESFGDLEALFLACYRQLVDDFRARLLVRLEAAPDDAPARCRAGLKLFFETVRDPHFARVAMFEVFSVSPAVTAVWQQQTHEFGALVMARYVSDAARSRLTKGEIESLGFSLIGAFVFSAIHWMQSGYRQPLARMVDAGTQLVAGIGAAVPCRKRSKP